jgi:hypothetical protein
MTYIVMPQSGGVSRISRPLDLPIHIACLFQTFLQLQRTNGFIRLTASAPNCVSISPRSKGYLAQSISQYASWRRVRCICVFELAHLIQDERNLLPTLARSWLGRSAALKVKFWRFSVL